MQKPTAFLHKVNELYEREITYAIPFTIALKTMKYLGINLTMERKIRNETVRQ